jgi:fructose-1,6-bisphosphatase/inositol monophosphatase family enzyme
MSEHPGQLLQKLGDLLREVSRTELLPRFRNLGSADVIGKATAEDPTDVVTIADRNAEAWLTERLPELVPGSRVIGEEAVSADASVLLRLHDSSPVWLVDPLDGTRNFAKGRGPFGPMVALVERGVILASGIHLTLADELFVAERGLGAFCDGAPLAPSPETAREHLSGTVFTMFMPEALARDLTLRAARASHQAPPFTPCAAHEYTEVARGRKDYDVYYRLMPWDHAPGALLLREIGGVSRDAGGRDYDVLDVREPMLIARSEATWAKVRADLFGT